MTRNPCRLRIVALLAIATLSGINGANAQEPPRAWVDKIGTPQYFAVLVEDVDRSAKWYRDTLGMQDVDGSHADDGSWRILNLRNEQLLVEIIRDNRATKVDRARGFFKVGFRVADVEVVADRAAQATGERPRVVDFEEHGMRLLQLRDPDGNRIQLFSPMETTR